jgi:hypothetical protein
VLAEKLEAYVPPAKRGGGERTTPHSGIVPEEQERQAA